MYRWMVRLKIQILVCVGSLALQRSADGAAFLPCQEDVQEGELPVCLLLHCKLDVVVDAVEVAVKGVDKVSRENGTSVINIPSP